MGEERESIEEMVLYWDEREGERGGKPKIFRGVLAPNSLSSRLGAIGARAWWAPPGRARIHCWPHLSRSPPPKTSETGGPTCSGAQQQQRPRCAGAAVRAEGSDGGRRRSHRGDVADRWGPLASAVRVGWTDSSCRFFRWWCWW